MLPVALTVFTLFFVVTQTVGFASGSVLFATSRAWDNVVKATIETEMTYVGTEPALSETELRQRFDEVWDGLLHLCPSLPEDGKAYVDVGFDDALLDEERAPALSRVLGWASRTELLRHGTWSGALATESGVDSAKSMGLATLGTIRVARSPPGGWFRGHDSACAYRFRLEDVLLHELLHLLGVSSSVRQLPDGKLAVGAEYLGTCFPGAFDREITDAQGNKVVGRACEFTGTLGQPLFVNGARLYAETEEGGFVHGTSLSHLMNSDAVLSPSVDACDPAGSRPLTSQDAMALLALDVQCDASALPRATVLNSQQTLSDSQSKGQTLHYGSSSPSSARCRVQSWLAGLATAWAALALLLS